MLPAFVVVAMGVNATEALVVSQIILSIALPVPMISLVIFTCKRSIMGDYANGWIISTLAVLGSVAVLSLNLILLLQTFGMPIPGLSP